MPFPYPPRWLQERVGGAQFDYDDIGAGTRRDFLALLPSSFKWNGAHALDFGSGAGRTLRHFGAEAELAAEFWACDIDAESVEWMQGHLCPPFRAFQNDPMPPLPFKNDSLDLIYSFSVFTHLADSWSAWLLELHRVLKPGGWLLATTLGPGAEAELGRAWDEDRIGCLVLMPDRGFEDGRGGPTVFHSEWWLREHWGRVFDVVSYQPTGFGVAQPTNELLGAGCAALQKREAQVTIEDLQRPSDDPREWKALEHNLEVVQARESAWHELANARDAELTALRSSRSGRLAHALAKLAAPFHRR